MRLHGSALPWIAAAAVSMIVFLAQATTSSGSLYLVADKSSFHK
jgi:hypothetical protein